MEIATDGGLAYKYVGTNLEINEKERQVYAKRYECEEKFSGEFSTGSYQKVCVKAQQYGLLGDSGIQYLLKQRKPDGPNHILQQFVKIEMTKELNNLLECVISLNILPNVFFLEGNTKELISSRKKVILESESFF